MKDFPRNKWVKFSNGKVLFCTGHNFYDREELVGHYSHYFDGMYEMDFEEIPESETKIKENEWLTVSIGNYAGGNCKIILKNEIGVPFVVEVLNYNFLCGFSFKTKDERAPESYASFKQSGGKFLDALKRFKQIRFLWENGAKVCHLGSDYSYISAKSL